MNTKWHFYILWSVFSLSVGNYVARKYESPSTRRPSIRTKRFKLNTQEIETNIEPTHTVTTHSDTISSSSQLGTELELTSRFQAPGSHGPRGQPYFAYLPDVSVTCSSFDFVVRVKTAFYGLGVNAEELRLGSTCKSNGVLGPHGDLLFTFRITECDVQREMPPDYIVYKYVLRYTPSPNRPKGSAHSFAVNIECRYPRYYHVYQLAVRPTWQTAIVHKKLRGRLSEFQIQLMDDTWNMPAKSQIYVLGQTVNLQVSASHLPSGGKVYISSCFATPYNGSTSALKYTLIDNFGCLLVSQKDPGGAQFVSSQDDHTIRFSLSAFQFTSDPNTPVQIQCELHVSSEGSSAVYKACTYEDNRWKALSGDDYICDCCESQCMKSKSKRAMLEGSANSGPILVSDQPPSFEDLFPSAVPPLISTTAEGELEDILALETKMNQPITEQGSPRNLPNTSNLSKTSGKEDQQTLKDSEVDDEEVEGDGSVWVDGAKAIGRLNQLGFGWGVITWEGEMSGMGDLDEFGEDGGLQYGVKEGLLETEENDELGSMDSSETKEAVPKDEAHELAGERLGKKEVESRVTVAQRKTSASGEKGTTLWADGGREGTRGEEVERPQSDVEWENDKNAQGDGLVETAVVGDKEMTWYFTWK
ncbi:unnamed protein product [Lota lota]